MGDRDDVQEIIRLRAEVGRLRAEVERLKHDMDLFRNGAKTGLNVSEMFDQVREEERAKTNEERAQLQARLREVEKKHGPGKRRCACPGCRKMIPSCWRSVLCYECGSEECGHAAAQPEGDSPPRYVAGKSMVRPTFAAEPEEESRD